MSWAGEPVLRFHNWWSGVAKIKAKITKDKNPLRIGILAAATINYCVIIEPCQSHPGITLVAIAARSKERAEAQIAKYDLGSTCRAYGSYDELLADADIDAVYIPTPNSLHTVWAVKAMEAGKHVLIEKPIASNVNEVRQIQDAAERTGKVVLEAFHWRFHPATHYCKAIIESREYGNVKSVSAVTNICKGMFGKDDIRWNYDLGAGACMDLTYVFSACMYFGTSDLSQHSVRVLEAKPRLYELDDRVDEAMNAKLIIEQEGRPPVSCDIHADLALPHLFGFIPQIWRLAGIVIIQLEKAEIEYANYMAPHLQHTLTIKLKDENGKLTGKKKTEKCFVGGPEWSSRGEVWWSTYRYQLEAFVDMVRAKEAVVEYEGPTVSLKESKSVMELIDNVYEKAGLPVRGS